MLIISCAGVMGWVLTVGDFITLEVVGTLEESLAIIEEVGASEAGEGKKAGFGVGVGFEGAIMMDVMDSEVLAKMAADENGAVTFQRVAFPAEQGDGVRLGAVTESFEAGEEERELGNEVVAGLTVEVALALGAACAEFCAEEDVLDVVVREGRFEGLAGEVWGEAAEGGGSHIRHGSDFVFLEERDEGFSWVIGVAEGEEGS
jgi:hypothetical protein